MPIPATKPKRWMLASIHYSECSPGNTVIRHRHASLLVTPHHPAAPLPLLVLVIKANGPKDTPR